LSATVRRPVLWVWSGATTVTMPIEEVIAAFDAFRATGNEYADVDQLRTLIAQWGEHPVGRQAMAIRSMFGLFARHPTLWRELGKPGPLIHALEAYGQDLGRAAYIELLGDSVRRQPAHYTLWMVNRVCNAEPDPALLQLLRGVSTSPAVDDGLREVAADFAEHQAGRRP
jgi:hypothetical protein